MKKQKSYKTKKNRRYYIDKIFLFYFCNTLKIVKIRAIFSNFAVLRCKLNGHCRKIPDIFPGPFDCEAILKTVDFRKIWYRLLYKECICTGAEARAEVLSVNHRPHQSYFKFNKPVPLQR